MKILKQISIYMENKKGQLIEILEFLKKYNVDIRALNTVEMEHFGVLRIIVNKTNEIYDLLKNDGFSVSINDVFMFAINDKEGGLCDLVSILSSKGVDIEYIYSVLARKDDIAFMIVAPKNEDIMIDVIKNNDLVLYDIDDL